MNVDISGLEGLKEFKDILEQAVEEAARDLSMQAYAKAVELAGERLKSRREMFVKGLQIFEDQGIWVLQLDGEQRWIDDGQPPHDMLDALLKSPTVKESKDGTKYVIVPFQHGPGTGPTNTPESSLPLVKAVKAEMKRRKIPWSKLERDSQGRPKVGRLHSFSIAKPPKTAEGPGQGKGPVGAARQGVTGIPFLQGVSVYQRADGEGNVKRSVMTFRVASEKHRGERWQHPGLEPVNIIDDTYKWALETLEKDIVPAVLAKITDRL